MYLTLTVFNKKAYKSNEIVLEDSAIVRDWISKLTVLIPCNKTNKSIFVWKVFLFDWLRTNLVLQSATSKVGLTASEKKVKSFVENSENGEDFLNT